MKGPRLFVKATPGHFYCETVPKFRESRGGAGVTSHLIRQYHTKIMSGKGKGGKGGRGAGKKSVSKSAKAGLQFPVARIGRFLKKVSRQMPFWLPWSTPDL